MTDILMILLFLILIILSGIFITCLYILENVKKEDKNKRRLVE